MSSIRPWSLRCPTCQDEVLSGMLLSSVGHMAEVCLDQTVYESPIRAGDMPSFADLEKLAVTHKTADGAKRHRIFTRAPDTTSS